MHRKRQNYPLWHANAKMIIAILAVSRLQPTHRSIVQLCIEDSGDGHDPSQSTWWLGSGRACRPFSWRSGSFTSSFGARKHQLLFRRLIQHFEGQTPHSIVEHGWLVEEGNSEAGEQPEHRPMSDRVDVFLRKIVVVVLYLLNELVELKRRFFQGNDVVEVSANTSNLVVQSFDQIF